MKQQRTRFHSGIEAAGIEARRSSPQRRWGPCPYCGATGWTTSAWKYDNPLFHHDRPQGGRCLQALEAEKRGHRAHVDPHNTVANNVRDYIAVDSRGRTLAGPFKSYSDAKHAAGHGGNVQYVRETGTAGVFEVDEGPGVSEHVDPTLLEAFAADVDALREAKGITTDQAFDLIAKPAWFRKYVGQRPEDKIDLENRIINKAKSIGRARSRVSREARPRPKAKRSAARRR